MCTHHHRGEVVSVPASSFQVSTARDTYSLSWIAQQPASQHEGTAQSPADVASQHSAWHGHVNHQQDLQTGPHGLFNASQQAWLQSGHSTGWADMLPHVFMVRASTLDPLHCC